MSIFDSRRYYSTGVLTRSEGTEVIRINFVNTVKRIQEVHFSFYDWSTLVPVLIKFEAVYINASECEVSDIRIISTGYGDLLNSKQYEVRLSLPSNDSIITNIYGTTARGEVNPANTILHNQLVPISRKQYAFDL